MATLITTKLGQNRGRKRVWLEGAKLSRENFNAGDKFNVQFSDGVVSLAKASDGKYTVSKRTRNGRLLPIIDLTLEQLADTFENVEMLSVKIMDGEIVISAHYSHAKRIQRETSTIKQIASGKALRTVSLFHGGGVLDNAIHDGLSSSLTGTKTILCNEIESAYLDSSIRNNGHLFDKNTVFIESPIESVNVFELAQLDLQADILVGSTPCTGASNCGKAKNKNIMAETHEKSGATFVGYLKMIELVNPSVIVLENVQAYSTTSSMAVIRSTLSTMGYNIHEADINGRDFGVHENRNRFVMVAVSKGLGEFDFGSVETTAHTMMPLSSILEDIPQDSPRFKKADYLATKELKDKAAGKGFMRQKLTGEETSCPVMGAGYAKIRSTDPHLLHSDGEKIRLFTPKEHCLIKGAPLSLIVGNSDTVNHQILGQSIIWPAFREIGRAIGVMMKQATEKLESIVAQTIEVAPLPLMTRNINVTDKPSLKTTAKRSQQPLYVQCDMFA